MKNRDRIEEPGVSVSHAGFCKAPHRSTQRPVAIRADERLSLDVPFFHGTPSLAQFGIIAAHIPNVLKKDLGCLADHPTEGTLQRDSRPCGCGSGKQRSNVNLVSSGRAHHSSMQIILEL